MDDYVKRQIEVLKQTAEDAISNINESTLFLPVYKSARKMLEHIKTYEEQGNVPTQFMLLLRFSSLVLEKLSHCKDAAKYRSELVELKKEAAKALQKATEVKERLQQIYRDEYREIEAQQERQRQQSRRNSAEPTTIPPPVQPRSPAPELTLPAPPPTNPSVLDWPDPSSSATPPNNFPHLEALTRQSLPHLPPRPTLTPPRNGSWSSNGLARLLRPMLVPAALVHDFTLRAATYTAANVEMCGVLAGTVQEQGLVVTTLILPKQSGDPDNCEIFGEEEMIPIVQARKLSVLGWIHTHPRQSLFLSSVDLHTQCGYQSQLAEAIAIVVAPTQRENPVALFHLNIPDGLDLIQRCTQSGFHEHRTSSPTDIFSICPHAELHPDLEYDTIDLRDVTRMLPTFPSPPT